MTKELFNSKDVAAVRKEMLREQDGKCLLTGQDIPENKAVLDHDHSTQYVRGVLHRQANAALGKIENICKRYLTADWYDGNLITFLKETIAYLERVEDNRYYHPGWIKKVKTEFRKLNSTQQVRLLRQFEVETGLNNSTTRLKAFSKLVLTRKYGYVTMLTAITTVKGQ